MHRFLINDRMMWMPALLLLFCLSIFSVNDSLAAETGAKKDGLAIHFRNYCVSCHNNETTEGDVNLFSQNSTALENDPQLTRLLIDVLDQQQMPPEDEEQPSADVRRGMLNQLQTILHTAVSQTDERIRTPIRRMNRFQYNNAVVDLFQLKMYCVYSP